MLLFLWVDHIMRTTYQLAKHRDLSRVINDFDILFNISKKGSNVMFSIFDSVQPARGSDVIFPMGDFRFMTPFLRYDWLKCKTLGKTFHSRIFQIEKKRSCVRWRSVDTNNAETSVSINICLAFDTINNEIITTTLCLDVTFTFTSKKH